MKKSTLLLSALSLGSLFLFACGRPEDGPSSLRMSASAEDSELPTLPSPTLAVPAGNELGFFLDAVGVQIYDCKATATGFGWGFRAPEATLYEGDEAMAIHFAGPTWQSLKDGSSVVGAKVAAFTPDPTAIPWLLLKAVSHDGRGRMAHVSYIQRLSTVGGLAPSSGCDATTVGASARVDYTATYYFYQPEDDPSGS